MFYHLEGTVSYLSAEKIALDCNGIGFKILITTGTASQVKKGEKYKLYISESIGEDHFDLYGFLTEKEKDYFELLTTVSGIGPKAALSILSYNTPESVSNAIANNIESAFTACPGIGKKTAQRLILELKDKITKGFESDIINYTPSNNYSNGAYDSAVTALVSLGYNQNEIIQIIKQIDIEGKSSEEIIKSVLRYMI